MFHRAFAQISHRSTGFSGARAYEALTEVIRYHRIQASPGYRAAAEHCVNVLHDAGLEVEYLRFPANHRTRYWTASQFQEWDCRGATLRLLTPPAEACLLADYDAQKLSLIQRSAPTPPGGIAAEIVLLERGVADAEYADRDVRGKLVFAGGEAARVHTLAVEKYGAAGIIVDPVGESRLAAPAQRRDRYDLPDALQYTAFRWASEEQRKGFGFVLSPRAGDRLRLLLRSSAAPVVAHAAVDARLYDGEMEIVTALIPGETDEEVAVVAHLCHPQPFANDNASGVATALEGARTLQRLIADGTLARPRRGIRFILQPEMAGSYCYLATHPERIPKMIAAINLDMVGEDQAACEGPLVLEHPPAACAGFAGEVLEAILRRLAEEDATNLAGTARYALFKWVATPFAGGSDHYIIADPTVGIPCPMLIHWPDKFYHTSADTLDKVDPAMLRRAGILACTYAYAIAAAGEGEALWLLDELGIEYRRLLPRRLAQTPDSRADDFGAWIDQQARFLLARHRAALEAVRRLDHGAQVAREIAEHVTDAERFTREERPRAHAVAARRLRDCGRPDRRVIGRGRDAEAPWTERAAVRVYRRAIPGPIARHWTAHRLTAEQQDEERALMARTGARLLATLGLYWMDGERTLLDVAAHVEMEAGVRDLEFLVRYADLLTATGALARVVPKETGGAT